MVHGYLIRLIHRCSKLIRRPRTPSFTDIRLHFIVAAVEFQNYCEYQFAEKLQQQDEVALGNFSDFTS
jgi:hypothetical protein